MRTIVTVLLAASALATAAVAETEGNYRQNVYERAEVDTSIPLTFYAHTLFSRDADSVAPASQVMANPDAYRYERLAIKMARCEAS